MATGTVKFYNATKGFGFIKSDDGQEFFVHVTGIKEGQPQLKDNDPVSYDVEEGRKGPMAVNVSIIE